MAYEAMLPKWLQVEALLGGTHAMRSAGELYMPRHAEESVQAYEERRQSATLLNMTELTLNSWVGRPFSDPVVPSDDMDDRIREDLTNVDKCGNNLDVFCRNWFRDGVAKGLSHVIVDFPEVPEDPNRTRQDDIDEDLRPYWVHRRPEQLFFAHAEEFNGIERTVHARFYNNRVEMDGFAEVLVEEIDVWTPGRVETWRRLPEKERSKNKVEWVRVGERSYGLDFVPLVTYYADRSGYMQAKPPVGDLSDLNISHWQSSSDQRSILTVARFPMLACAGATDDGDKLVVGPKQLLFTKDPQGRYYYVEHSGKSIAAGRQDLMDLEEQMGSYGADFLRKKPGNPTATARALDSSESTSPLQDMTVRFVDAVNTALEYHAAWLDAEQPGTVEITTDFGPDLVDQADLAELGNARRNGDLSREDYLQELKRRGLLSDEFDPIKNRDRLRNEGLDDIPDE